MFQQARDWEHGRTGHILPNYHCVFVREPPPELFFKGLIKNVCCLLQNVLNHFLDLHYKL